MGSQTALATLYSYVKPNCFPPLIDLVGATGNGQTGVLCRCENGGGPFTALGAHPSWRVLKAIDKVTHVSSPLALYSFDIFGGKWGLVY